jgi:hypothetical protein
MSTNLNSYPTGIFSDEETRHLGIVLKLHNTFGNSRFTYSIASEEYVKELRQKNDAARNLPERLVCVQREGEIVSLIYLDDCRLRIYNLHK